MSATTRSCWLQAWAAVALSHLAACQGIVTADPAENTPAGGSGSSDASAGSAGDPDASKIDTKEAAAAGGGGADAASGPDAAPDSAPEPGAEASPPDVQIDPALDSTPAEPPPDQGVDVSDAADAAPPWDHTCWCKNWKGDAYPSDFFVFSCVDDYACPGGYVCCAITCVSPEICVNTALGWDNCEFAVPNDCCIDGRYTRCVLPEKCAPEGVLSPKQYDPAVNSFVMCGHPN
jgi:hypothetical protein